jgi:DivIVA domain-containing protein
MPTEEAVPLTPEDVRSKRFTPVRLREGYDMGEVDAFLDEVEAELARLHSENDDLRAKLAAATGGEAPAPRAAVEEKVPEEVEEPKKEAAPAQAAPSETIQVTTAAEASSAATRLLELATRNADELVSEARKEAEEILGTARTDAERLESESKARAEQLDQEARTRAQQLEVEAENRRREILGEIEREKTRLDGEVENLRVFEREYRGRLKSYFTEQLAALESSGDDTAEAS